MALTGIVSCVILPDLPVSKPLDVTTTITFPECEQRQAYLQFQILGKQGKRRTSIADSGCQSRYVQIEIDASHLESNHWISKPFARGFGKNAGICIEHPDHSNDNL